MPRTQPKYLSSSYKKELLNVLWSLVTVLESREEVENFFKDLLSETEALMLARRIQIAKLLLSGKGYEEISEEMKTSYATVAKVHRWLQSGSGGYRRAIPHLEKELKKQEKWKDKREKQKQFGSIEWLKKRYPLHFLLLNLADLPQTPTFKKKKKRN